MRFLALFVGLILGTTFAAQTAHAAVTEAEIVKDPILQDLLQRKFKPSQFDSRGGTGSNKRFDQGDPGVPRFDVGTQRDALGLIARGVAEHDNSFIDIGLRAIDYGFEHQDPVRGNFGQSGYVETAAFVAFTIRAYYLILESSFASQYRQRLKSYIPKLELAGRWLADPRNPRRVAWYRRRSGTSNQVAAAGFALAILGRLTGSERYVREGERYIEHVLENQQKNGVFPEYNTQTATEGPDSSYQVVTLDALDWYILYFPDSRLSFRVRKALDKGWEWEKSQISSEGKVSDAHNVRTGRGGERNFFGKKKKISYAMIVIALVYRAHIVHNPEDRQLAESVYRYALKLYREHRLG